MRRQDSELSKGWGQIATPLAIETPGGKQMKRAWYKRENLREHFTDLELLFSMLGEATTTEITQNRNAQGFIEKKRCCGGGGN